jgi:hypothetical protein
MGQLIFTSKRSARASTSCEFTKELAEKHAIIKGKKGWVRVLCRSAEAARTFERMWAIARRQEAKGHA